VFLGDRASEFSDRLFARLTETPALLVGVLDSPPRAGSSTNPVRRAVLPGGARDFVEFAGRAGIPTRRPRDPSSTAARRWLRQLAPDLFVSAGFFGILKAQTLAIPALAPINFHASLLPAYRGKHPVFWALFHGEKRTGITAHVMTELLDQGPVVYQRTVRVRARDSVPTLYARIIDAGLPLVDRLVADAICGKVPTRPQADCGASYFSSPTDNEFSIDWSMPAAKIETRVRAAPGRCFFLRGDERVRLLRVRAARDRDGSVRLEAGEFALCRNRLKVGTGAGGLWLEELTVDGVQKSGKVWYAEVLVRSPGVRRR